MRTRNEQLGDLKTARVALQRRSERGDYSREGVRAILDQTFLCHIGFTIDGQPYVIPTSFGRDGDKIYIHGSAASRMLRSVARGFPICATMMILDGIVLAKSAFNHSMNYRSVVLLGTATLLEKHDKLHALEVIAEHMIPGRWRECRPPNDKELLATSVISVDIKEASAKVRLGPPLDDDEDLDYPCWAGVLPIVSQMQPPIDDVRSRLQIERPGYMRMVRGIRVSTLVTS